MWQAGPSLPAALPLVRGAACQAGGGGCCSGGAAHPPGCFRQRYLAQHTTLRCCRPSPWAAPQTKLNTAHAQQQQPAPLNPPTGPAATQSKPQQRPPLPSPAPRPITPPQRPQAAPSGSPTCGRSTSLRSPMVASSRLTFCIVALVRLDTVTSSTMSYWCTVT